tara:strand:+ start:927 stop:1517 length:591 start_codon:yes stop_codon:yes gene_type:complete
MSNTSKVSESLMDKYVIARFDKICKLSEEVANEISPFIYSDEESWYQTALSYEMSNASIAFTKEMNITQYYKNIPFEEKKVDFFIHSDKKNYSGIFLETKANKDKNELSMSTDVERGYRRQLFRYIYSSKNSSDELIKNSNYGILLFFGGSKIEDNDLFHDSKIQKDRSGITLELWRSANSKRSEFELLKSFSKEI